MLGVMSETLEREGGSMRGDEDFFSVAKTMPLVANMVSCLNEKTGEKVAPLMPSEVTP